ncbi:MAG: DUF2997 domain-containing protein [Leptolyngbya sp. SIO1E4]|nr:DUF2997 domain-containing protein [Leptolyngbya sp. SIO1E4]
METLEFIIYPDGRVKEMVTGVVGRSCEEVTRRIEEQLGNVVNRETTSEFYQQSVQQTATTETQTNVSYGDWG